MAFNLAKKKYPSNYILTLDARHILNGSIKKKKLRFDSYQIIQHRMSLHYFNLRLLKTSLPWICKGVVHEYWESPGCSRGTISTAFITENGIEVDKTRKIQWYKELLEQGISEEKDENLKLRYLFYLANSLYDLKDYRGAIDKYLERSKSSGWQQEIWYCYYRIGMSYENIQQPEAAIGYYLKCSTLIPERAENLYRSQGDMKKAFEYGMLGVKMPEPQGLFVESAIYSHLLHFEISISGYYVDKNIAAESQKKLMSMQLPEWIATQVKDNNKWYS